MTWLQIFALTCQSRPGAAETAFAEADMPVDARGEQAFSIRCRGTYVDVVTVLLLDMTDRCPKDGSQCVGELLDAAPFLDVVDADESGLEFDVEIVAERGSCIGSVEQAGEVASVYRRAVDLNDEDNNGWVAKLTCGGL